jgi:hypothetical protein
MPTLPTYPGSIDNMDYATKAQYRAAAFRVARLFPGILGQVLSDEILGLEEFGWLPGANARGARLVADIDSIESVQFTRKARS